MPKNNGFKSKASIEVRFRDTDAFGHVNNAVYLSYIEMGRAHYWKDVFGLDDYSKVGFILAHVTIDFRSPAYMGETLLVWTRVPRLGTKSFDCQYEIRDKKSNRLIAEETSAQVMFDYSKNLSKPIPDSMKERIAKFEGLIN
jgi:acyl-CoA thioester hydrolase